MFPDRIYPILIVNLVLTTKQPVSSPSTGAAGPPKPAPWREANKLPTATRPCNNPALLLEGGRESPEESQPCPTHKSLLQHLVGQRCGIYLGALGHVKILSSSRQLQTVTARLIAEPTLKLHHNLFCSKSLVLPIDQHKPKDLVILLHVCALTSPIAQPS